jgi:hypothetical protein
MVYIDKRIKHYEMELLKMVQKEKEQLGLVIREEMIR